MGAFTLNLNNLTTATASASDLGGLFCPGQKPCPVPTNEPGCQGAFGHLDVTDITATGMPAGTLSIAPAHRDAALASVLCIPSTGNAAVDAAADLPGPAAVLEAVSWELLDLEPGQ